MCTSDLVTPSKIERNEWLKTIFINSVLIVTSKSPSTFVHNLKSKDLLQYTSDYFGQKKVKFDKRIGLFILIHAFWKFCRKQVLLKYVSAILLAKKLISSIIQ